MKNRIYFGIIIFCSLQLLVLFFWRMNAAADILQVEYDGSRLYFYYRCMDRLYHDDSNIQINSYQDEKSGEFYLFFPKAFEGKRSKLLLYGADELVVNRQFYRNDDKIGFLEEGRYSVAVGESFYVLNVMYGGDIPSVFISLETGNMDYVHEEKENSDTGSMNMYDADGALLYSNSLLDMHGRGNYSWRYHRKKGYAISLAAKGALTGNTISDRWNLIGSSYDPYLIKNKIIYDMSYMTGLEYSPRTEYIELYVCGEYMGTYLLTNKIKIGQDSVDIIDLGKQTEAVNGQQLEAYEAYAVEDGEDIDSKGFHIPNNPADISGGYLIEQEIYDRYAEEPSGFRTASGSSFVIQSPEYASREQVDYIQAYMQELETALSGDGGINPENGKHYTAYIDMESFVKDYLLQEISKNYDMNVTSQYFYKPSGDNSVLYAGPVWDFDNSMGTSSNYMGGDEITGTKMDNPRDLLAEYYFYREDNFSFPSFYLHDDFKQAAIRAYYQEFKPRLNTILETGLEEYGSQLGNSNEMNRIRWQLDKDWQTEISKIKDFMTKRMEFLDEVWGNE